MLKNMNTRKKLFLFPILFIVIMGIVVSVYIHYISMYDARNSASVASEKFKLDMLQTRFWVSTFLRVSISENENIVLENIKQLKNNVKEAISSYSDTNNIKLANEIISLMDDYERDFLSYSKDKIKNFSNDILKEEAEITAKSMQMSKIGVKIQENLSSISKRAVELRDEAEVTMENVLITAIILSVILFLIISILISNNIVNSLEKFKTGLLNFFSYLNRESNEARLVELLLP